MNPRRKLILASLVLLTLGTVNLWSFEVLSQARSQAVRAVHDADACSQVSSHIIALRTKPTVAGIQEQAPEELSKRIESAARDFGIVGDNLASIEPDPAMRLADSPYLEKPTTVQLRQVTLPELIGFLCRLSRDGGDLRIKALRMTAPPHEETGDQWSVELTITYLIYSPLPARQASEERS